MAFVVSENGRKDKEKRKLSGQSLFVLAAGRIGGIFNALACSSVPMGSFALAGLSMALSVKEMYMLMGVLSIMIFLLLGQWKGVAELEE